MMLLCIRMGTPRRSPTWRAYTISAPPSSSFSTSSQPPKSPVKPSKTWERSAKLVKNIDVTNPYLDRVRAEVVDPALQIKTIEDELCGAIGKALGKQGEKVLMRIREREEERVRFLEHLAGRAHDEAMQSARRHNEARERAVTARWELLVHRQAVGFTVDNHSVVHQTFPIAGPLPVRMEEVIAMAPPEGGVDGGDDDRKSMNRDSSSEQRPQKKVWGDQLSWWQSVGRWR